MLSAESLSWSVNFVNPQANGQQSLRFCALPRNCFCIFQLFWTVVFNSTYGRLLLQQYFSFWDLLIRPPQSYVSSFQLNNNSLLKTFFPRSIYDRIRLLHLYIIVTLQPFVYDICILFTGKKLNKQTNKQTTEMVRVK